MLPQELGAALAELSTWVGAECCSLTGGCAKKKLSTNSGGVGHGKVTGVGQDFVAALSLVSITCKHNHDIPFCHATSKRQPMLRSVAVEQPHHCLMLPEFPYSGINGENMPLTG